MHTVELTRPSTLYLLTRHHVVLCDRSWEFEAAPTRVPLSEVDWENPKLVSVIVMRDPIR